MRFNGIYLIYESDFTCLIMGRKEEEQAPQLFEQEIQKVCLRLPMLLTICSIVIHCSTKRRVQKKKEIGSNLYY